MGNAIRVLHLRQVLLTSFGSGMGDGPCCCCRVSNMIPTRAGVPGSFG